MNAGSLRIDKWLWYARFFKSRSLASRLCASGRLRRNGELIGKSHALLKVGDVLTFPKEKHIRVIKVMELGTRRGPASEAITLYEDLEPPMATAKDDKSKGESPGARLPGSGRPTKAQRRAIDKLKNQS